MGNYLAHHGTNKPQYMNPKSKQTPTSQSELHRKIGEHVCLWAKALWWTAVTMVSAVLLTTLVYCVVNVFPWNGGGLEKIDNRLTWLEIDRAREVKFGLWRLTEDQKDLEQRVAKLEAQTQTMPDPFFYRPVMTNSWTNTLPWMATNNSFITNYYIESSTNTVFTNNIFVPILPRQLITDITNDLTDLRHSLKKLKRLENCTNAAAW